MNLTIEQEIAMKDSRQNRNGEKGWMEEIVTLQHRFSTHTYFEFDYIITAHVEGNG